MLSPPRAPFPTLARLGRAAARVFSFASCLAFSSACSLLVDAGRHQCATDGDCEARGAAFAGSLCVDQICQPSQKWACLSTTRPVSSEPGPYTVTIAKVSDVVTQQALAGATVKLCRKLDVACSTPVSTVSAAADGSATFSLEANFAGYLEVTATGYLPTLYFFNPTVDRDLTLPNVPVGSTLANTAILGALGVTPDPSRGTIVVISVDCTGAPASGISYSTPGGDAESRVFYYVDGLPTAAASATTSAGYGGIANVPPGAVTFNARLASPAVDLPPISLVVRGGALSFSQVVPFGS